MDDPMAKLLAGSQTEGVPAQIAQAIKAANDNEAAVNNLNDALRIIAYGPGTTLTPTGTTYPTADVTLDAGLATSFLCFMTRSDQTGKVYQMPYLEATGAAGSLQARLLATANVYQGGIHFAAVCATDYVSPPTLTFYYVMLGQPANATS